MPRYFTLAEAERLLPEVEREIRDALRLKAQHQQAEEKLQAVAQRITLSGGALIDRERLLADKAEVEASSRRLREVIESIHGYGCQVKDLDIGLIDFPTLFRGAEVCLCWKLGEDGIRFWHGEHEGFAGRKPIDQDFLDHHRGDSPGM